MLLGAFALACAPAPEGNGRSILLITLDTTRADRIGAYGSSAASTPAIDALARRGVLFERAYASIPVTLPSHTTILTGLYPNEHGVRDNGVYRVPEEATTLAELLRDRGYRTGAFVSAHVLDSRYRIDQGFETYDDEMEEPLRVSSPVPRGAKLPDHTKRWLETWGRPYQRRAEVTVERALGWLDGSDRPFFCWVHLFDPHLSYEPPAPYDTLFGDPYDGPVDGTGESFHELAKSLQGRVPREHLDRMIALYDGEIAYADAWIGRLLAAVPDSTIVIFTADHGEALGEHGQFFEHQMTIYEETMRVPLVLAGPGVPEPGTRRSEPAGSVDVFPTALGLLGLGATRDARNASGVDLFDSRPPADRALYSETRASLTAVPTKTGFRGVRGEGWALIREIEKPDRIQREQLFHTENDPGETIDRARENVSILQKLASSVERFTARGAAHDEDPAAFWSLDEGADRRAQLEALGYLGGKD